MQMGTDMFPEAEDKGEFEVDGKAGKGGHARVGLLFFVLVRQNALCHNGFTSLVIDLVRKPILSSLSIRANGVFIILGGGSGVWQLPMEEKRIKSSVTHRIDYRGKVSAFPECAISFLSGSGPLTPLSERECRLRPKGRGSPHTPFALVFHAMPWDGDVVPFIPLLPMASFTTQPLSKENVGGT